VKTRSIRLTWLGSLNSWCGNPWELHFTPYSSFAPWTWQTVRLLTTLTSLLWIWGYSFWLKLLPRSLQVPSLSPECVCLRYFLTSRDMRYLMLLDGARPVKWLVILVTRETILSCKYVLCTHLEGACKSLLFKRFFPFSSLVYVRVSLKYELCYQSLAALVACKVFSSHIESWPSKPNIFPNLLHSRSFHLVFLRRLPDLLDLSARPLGFSPPCIQTMYCFILS